MSDLREVRTGRRWLWFCTIPFWALLIGAAAVAVLEDASMLRFVVTVAGGAAISGALIGLLVLVARTNARALTRPRAEARLAQIRAWTVIGVLAGVVAAGAGIAMTAGVDGAVALLAAALLVLFGTVVAVWRRTRGGE